MMARTGRNVVAVNMPYTETALANGGKVTAMPQDDDEYRQRARDLGYGEDTFAMSRDHEILHSRLAVMLGLDESPTMRGIVDHENGGAFYEHWQEEEAAVLAIQRFIRVANIRFP